MLISWIREAGHKIRTDFFQTNRLNNVANDVMIAVVFYLEKAMTNARVNALHFFRESSALKRHQPVIKGV